jgi:hypothetical protein
MVIIPLILFLSQPDVLTRAAPYLYNSKYALLYFIKTTGKVTVFCRKITIFAAIIKIV